VSIAVAVPTLQRTLPDCGCEVDGSGQNPKITKRNT
jgi:hypothetical protein